MFLSHGGDSGAATLAALNDVLGVIGMKVCACVGGMGGQRGGEVGSRGQHATLAALNDVLGVIGMKVRVHVLEPRTAS